MPDLNFKVEGVESEPYSAAPLLVFKLGIDQPRAGAGGVGSGAVSAGPAGATPVHAIALRCQIRLDPARRRYTDAEKGRLLDLFGRPSQWAQTLRGMLWTHASTVVPAFASATVADLPVPCTYDLGVAMTKYFDALDDGDVPLSFLFSGTVFYEGDGGALQAAPISWEKDAEFRMPARVWRDMMDRHYPNGAWLCLDKPTLVRLREYKERMRHMTWEQAVDDLLQAAEQKAPG